MGKTGFKSRLRTVVLTMMASSGFMVACGQQKTEQQAITALMEQQTLCWNRGDIKGFMATYWQNDSLCFIGKKDVTYGWQNALQRYEKSYPDQQAMGKLRFNLQQIKLLSPRYCFVIGHWHLSRQAGDLEGEFTLLLKKMNGEWKIIVDHSS